MYTPLISPLATSNKSKSDTQVHIPFPTPKFTHSTHLQRPSKPGYISQLSY